MLNVIERLQREKDEEKKEYREEGITSGIEWAKSARHRELKRVVVNKDGIEQFYYRNGGIPSDIIELSIGIHKYISEVFAKDPLLCTPVQGAGLVLDECLSEEATEWFLGWMEGVVTVWSQVEDKL